MRKPSEALRRSLPWLLWWLPALALPVYNGLKLWSALRHSDLTAADFSTFYVAGRLVDAGRIRQLYDLHAQAGMQLNPHFRLVPLPFNHGAYEALLFAPLAALPYLTSYLIWNLCSLALLAWMALRLAPRLNALKASSPLLIFLLALAFWPNAMALLQGQDSILLAALMTGTYLALKEDREAMAGFLLALGLFKFHLVLILLACFLLNRQWRLAKSFSATAAALAALSLAMVGRSGAADYIAMMRSLNRMPLAIYTKPAEMPNLRGLLAFFMASAPQWLGPAILLASALVFFAVLLRLPGDDRAEKFDLFFALATVITYVLSFNTYAHDMAILFPGLLLLSNVVAKREGMAWKSACAIVIATLFASPLYLRLYFHRALALLCLPTLLLIGLMAFAPEMERRHAEPGGGIGLQR